MDTYDDAAFDRFCSGLINAGFSPTHVDGLPYWTGPIRPSLRPLTDSTWMQVRIYAGWPLRYAHVYIEGLRTEHDAQGTICLWAEDDPAQIEGRELQALWERLDQWAAAAQGGFDDRDRALDAYRLFGMSSEYRAELELGALIDRGGDGYVGDVFATVQGKALLIEYGVPPDPRTVDKAVLRGAFYLRADVAVPPRTLDDVLATLARRQRRDLQRGLARRAAASLAEPSGGLDFIVLAWPRHGNDHDAVVLGFSGAGDTLQASAMAASSTDMTALRRRAGPDADHLATKKVLVAGVGSVGGHVAIAVASSGVGSLDLCDSDRLTRTNLVRHVCTRGFVGFRKTHAVGFVVRQHAPWSAVTHHGDLPHDPAELLASIEAVDLVIDCTGIFSITAALAETCRRCGLPLITGALYHHGALARVQRQADGDTLIAARRSDPRYLPLPPEDQDPAAAGFLELGCTAPVNNAPPISVLSTAAEIANAAVDLLSERRERPDERIIVFRPMNPPFDNTGTIDPNREAPSATS